MMMMMMMMLFTDMQCILLTCEEMSSKQSEPATRRANFAFLPTFLIICLAVKYRDYITYSVTLFIISVLIINYFTVSELI